MEKHVFHTEAEAVEFCGANGIPASAPAHVGTVWVVNAVKVASNLTGVNATPTEDQSTRVDEPETMVPPFTTAVEGEGFTHEIIGPAVTPPSTATE